MTQSKIKAMQTALLKYNELARKLLPRAEQSDYQLLQHCLKRGEEALKVEVRGRS